MYVRNTRWWIAAACLGTVVAIGSRIGITGPVESPVDSRRAGEQTANKSADGPFIVHEWGTFTSFSGSNGVQLEFRPLVDVDLPDFVFDHELQSRELSLSKSRIRARVRMETPVTYFYTDRERTVRASVEFPQGLLTEFYPPVAEIAPKTNPRQVVHPELAGGKLNWGEVRLIPIKSLAAGVADERTRDWLQNRIAETIVPHEGPASNHYYTARQTDSALVHMQWKNPENPEHVEDHIEKFLFYRGVGRFDQPVKVTVREDGRVDVTNTCSKPIRSLIRLTVQNSELTISEFAGVLPGETKSFPMANQAVNLDQLKQRMVELLVGERLYEREALAMVNTWADSWFAEEGTRLFYMVPQETTEHLLPLTITPTPDETVRVLVGRVEVMTPSVERELIEVVRLRAKHRESVAKQNAEKQVNEPIVLPIPKRLQSLGRLAEPALVRVAQLTSDAQISSEASRLLQEIRAAAEAHPTVTDASN